MKALVYDTNFDGNYKLIEREKPTIKDSKDAIVEVTMSSICTSDLHIIHNKVPNAKNGITLGHEYVGRVVEVGPEVIAGSSRMKAGTAQKMVLNMLTTGAMIKIGKTYENFMIDLLPTNEKLKDRAIRIVAEIAKVNASTALKTLLESNWNVKISILMLKCDLTYMESKELLRNMLFSIL